MSNLWMFRRISCFDAITLLFSLTGPTSRPKIQPKTAQTISHYHILENIGGGMGVV